MKYALQTLECEFNKINMILDKDDISKIKGYRHMNKIERNEYIEKLMELQKALIKLNTIN